MAEDLTKLDNWLNKTEDKLDGGKIQRPGTVEVCYDRPPMLYFKLYNSCKCIAGSIVDACQALTKARELRAEFDKREKPLSTLKELVGDTDPEIKAFSTKFERIKKLSEFYLSKVRLNYSYWGEKL